MKLSDMTFSFLVSTLAIGGQTTAINSYAAGPTTSVAEAANELTNFACIDYQLAGVCLWLRCTFWGCSTETSVKVKHYIPDLVVQVYTDNQSLPLADVNALMPSPHGAVNSARRSASRLTERKIKAADAFGNPLSSISASVFNGFEYACGGSATAYQPYFVSSLDFTAWRLSVPEMVYPESLNIFNVLRSSSTGAWGNLYPRNGYIQQSDEYKATAIIAQRVGDIVTRSGQPHVYTQLKANSRDGYWPPGELNVADEDSGKWQMLLPRKENSCKVFPSESAITSNDRSKYGAYAWNLWRPYSCCQRRGQFFITSIDW